MNVMTVDPGISGSGWAVWNHKWLLQKSGICYSNAQKWENKMKMICAELRTIAKKEIITKVYVEEPKKFQSVFGGMVADKGDLVKLSLFVGYLSGFMNQAEIEVEYVPIIKWKGTLSKKIVEERVKKVFPKLNIKSHAIDAVGIGLYLRGQKEFK